MSLFVVQHPIFRTEKAHKFVYFVCHLDIDLVEKWHRDLQVADR